MKKTIVIFSNPFGYGPTGKSIALADALLELGLKNIILAGSVFIHEIVPDHIKYIKIDERNENEIRNLLRGINNPLVISSQNRFSVKVAHSLKIPSAFVDGLAWFWKKIPSDHLIADEIFWLRYPGIENKVPFGYRNIHIVPAAINIKSKKVKRDQILIHLGGCMNPITDIFPSFYLDMIIDALPQITNGQKIKITGGSQAMLYLRSKILTSDIELISLKHDQFIDELNRSAHFITTAGQTATLEAFALNVPTSFLLPMNLSQMALANILSEVNAAPQNLRWEDYLDIKEDLTLLTEKEAIIKFEVLAASIKNDTSSAIRLRGDIKKIINNVPSINEQKKFIEYVGTDGAVKIIKILINKWNL